MSSFVLEYLNGFAQVVDQIKTSQSDCIEQVVESLRVCRRLFILGVGGSAANASHAVADFRKLCHIEAYSVTDNVAELTARVNDDGWATVFEEWLAVSGLGKLDVVMVLSVGGGDEERNISPNIVKALQYAKKVDAHIVGIVGRDGGYTARSSDFVLITPTVTADLVTPYCESMQSVLLHLLASHPRLKVMQTKWESI